MVKLIIAIAIIAVAAIMMLIKWPDSFLGYIYCVGVGMAMAFKFLYPFTAGTYEALHCLTLGGGIGAIFGLFFALAIHQKIGTAGILGCTLLLPVIMFIVGFFVVLALGLFAMIRNGDGNLVLGSAVVMWGLIAALIGGGGSIIVIILDN